MCAFPEAEPCSAAIAALGAIAHWTDDPILQKRQCKNLDAAA
jgi:hypothetical protein